MWSGWSIQRSFCRRGGIPRMPADSFVAAPSAPLSGVESSIILAQTTLADNDRPMIRTDSDGYPDSRQTKRRDCGAPPGAAAVRAMAKCPRVQAGHDPPNVYSRVRTDYEGRLSRVIDELGGRTAELQQVVDALSTQVASLQTEESAKRDQQA